LFDQSTVDIIFPVMHFIFVYINKVNTF